MTLTSVEVSKAEPVHCSASASISLSVSLPLSVSASVCASASVSTDSKCGLQTTRPDKAYIELRINPSVDYLALMLSA